MAPIKKKTHAESEPKVEEKVEEKVAEVAAEQPAPVEQPKPIEQPKVESKSVEKPKKKMLRIKKRKKICVSGQVIELREGDMVDIGYKRFVEGSVEYEEVLV